MLVYNVEKKYIFIHNLRTSGTSISRYLRENDDAKTFIDITGHRYEEHMCYAQASKVLRLDDYFAFGFVRNPFSREWSLYNHVMRAQRTRFKNLTFKQFVIESNIHLRPQYGYFCDLDGRLKCKVYRFEERQAAIQDIANNIHQKDFSEYFYRGNSYNTGLEYINEYDNEMIDVMYKRYSVDFDAFGYSFDSCNSDDIKTIDFTFDVDPFYYDLNFYRSQAHPISVNV